MRVAGAWRGVAASLVLVVLVAPARVEAQDPDTTQASGIVATAAAPADRWLATHEPIVISLSRAPGGDAGRLAVFVGRTDVSALTTRQGTEVTYRPAPAAGTGGETDVSVHLVAPDGEWTEIGRFPVRILDPAGFQQLGVAPTLELISDGDFDRGQELTATMGFAASAVRPGWALRTTANAVGVTLDEQRLRFGERGLDAPAVDLSDYLIAFETGPVAASVGHVSFGASRHLISGFASRGVSGGMRIGEAARVGIAALNGSSVVGWSNPLGLDRSDHRMFAGSVEVEVVPSQPGVMRFDATVLDGSLLPQAGYTQGVVNDAETGSGFGLQVALSDPGQRARLSGGFTRARFTNPADPLLAQGTDLVPVRSTTRNARYLEGSLHLLRGVTLPTGLSASLSAGFRHERLDPLFRSIASPAQADIQRNAYEATAAIGQLAVQFSHGRSRDNLDDLVSILTTHTRDNSLSASLPIGALFRAPFGAWYWPSLNLGYQTVHQRGGGIPENGGFNESHVPDQFSRNLTLSLGWQHAAWDLTWAHNASRQDNRQPGREAADFEARVHTVSLGVRPLEPLRVSLDLSTERQHALELDQVQRARRIGLSTDWTVFRNSTLQGSAAYTRSDDRPLTQEQENVELRLEASQGFDLYRHTAGGTQARAFLRYARSRAWMGGPAGGFLPNETVWSVATGLSLRLY